MSDSPPQFGPVNENHNSQWTALQESNILQPERSMYLQEKQLEKSFGPPTDAELKNILGNKYTDAYLLERARRLAKTTCDEEDLSRQSAVEYQLLTPDEIRDFPPKLWIIRDRLPDAALLTYTYGPPESGKSLVCFRDAHAISTGQKDSLGFVVDQQRPVLYIDTEGKWDFQERMTAIEEATGVAFSGDWFRCISEQEITFASERNVERLIKTIEKWKPLGSGLVVYIDTQAGVTEGVNENTTEAMSPVIANFIRVARAFNGPVNVVHHSPKDGTDLRGSSSMRAKARVLTLIKDGSIKCEKFNGHKRFTGFKFEVRPYGDSVVAFLPLVTEDTVKLEKVQKELATRRAVFSWVREAHLRGDHFIKSEVVKEVMANVPGVTKNRVEQALTYFIKEAGYFIIIEGEARDRQGELVLDAMGRRTKKKWVHLAPHIVALDNDSFPDDFLEMV